MATFSSQVLFSIFLLQTFCQSAWAYEYCGTLSSIAWYCYDSGASIGYCCGHNSYTYYCCHYTAVWGLWYLWVGIVFFCILVSGLIACCRRRNARSRVQRSTMHVATVTTTYPANSQIGVENANFTAGNDAPPSYQQLQPGYPPKYDATTQHDLPQSSFPAPQQNQPPLNSNMPTPQTNN